jgi:hypothetical protein
MKKSLKRLLARVRAATGGGFRGPGSARHGPQEPQRMQAAPARARPRRLS